MIQLIEHETPRALELIESVHGHGTRLAPEYPLVFQNGFAGETLALGEGDEIRAACALIVRDLVLPSRAGETHLRVGLIGSVSTGDAWRGQGLGTRLIVEAEARLQTLGCAAVFLWADDPRFYLQRGYGPVGCEEDVIIPAILAPHLPAPTGVRTLANGDIRQVHKLYSGHSARVERTLEETAALIACPRMDALVREVEGKVVAYALRGRGRDLAEVVHEWGGPVDDVLALLRAHLERRFASSEPGALIAMMPAGAGTLLDELEALGCQHTTGILGLGKILDTKVAAEAIAERLGVLGNAAPTVIENELGQAVPCLRVSGPAGECFLDDEATLALLFASSDVRPSAHELVANIGLPEADLPLQPFFWGLDSI